MPSRHTGSGAAYCYVDRERPCVQTALNSSTHADCAAATRPAADDNEWPLHTDLPTAGRTGSRGSSRTQTGASAAGRDLGPRGRMLSAQLRQSGLLANSCALAAPALGPAAAGLAARRRLLAAALSLGGACSWPQQQQVGRRADSCGSRPCGSKSRVLHCATGGSVS